MPVAAELSGEGVIHIGAYAGYRDSGKADITVKDVILVPGIFVLGEGFKFLRRGDDYAVLQSSVPDNAFSMYGIISSPVYVPG